MNLKKELILSKTFYGNFKNKKFKNIFIIFKYLIIIKSDI